MWRCDCTKTPGDFWEVTHEKGVDRRNICDGARLCSEHVGAGGFDDEQQSDPRRKPDDHRDGLPARRQRARCDRHERHGGSDSEQRAPERSIHADQRKGRLEFVYRIERRRGRHDPRIQLERPEHIDRRRGGDDCRHRGGRQFEQHADERIDLRPRGIRSVAAQWSPGGSDRDTRGSEFHWIGGRRRFDVNSWRGRYDIEQRSEQRSVAG